MQLDFCSSDGADMRPVRRFLVHDWAVVKSYEYEDEAQCTYVVSQHPTTTLHHAHKGLCIDILQISHRKSFQLPGHLRRSYRNSQAL